MEGLIKRNYDWRIIRDDIFSLQYKGQPIVIFGAGVEGAITNQILKKNGYNVYAFADNNREKWGGVIDTKTIMSPEILSHQKDTFFGLLRLRVMETKFINKF